MNKRMATVKKGTKKAASADIWMPLYIDAYLGDTMNLSTLQHGALLLLLMHHWRAGGVPDDDAQLAAITRCDLATWKKTISPVLRKLFTKDERTGLLVQKRCAAEKEAALALTAAKSEAGSLGANRRWNKEHREDGTTNSTAIAEPLAEPLANERREQWQEDAPIPLPSSLRSDIPSPDGDGAAEPPRDDRGVLFHEGLELAQSLLGKPADAARAFLGQALKRAHDDAGAVLAALRKAERVRPADPRSWLLAEVERRPGAAGRGAPDSARELAAAANRARIAALEDGFRAGKTIEGELA